MVCPKFNSHIYKLKRWAIREHVYLYFATSSFFIQTTHQNGYEKEKINMYLVMSRIFI
jgi:hypothetical protein